MDLMSDLLNPEADDAAKSNDETSSLDEFGDLLGGVSYDDAGQEPPPTPSAMQSFMQRFQKPKEDTAAKPAQAAKPAKARTRSGGFTQGQKMILGGMGVMILLIYVVLIIVVAPSLFGKKPTAPAANQGVTVMTPAGTAVTWTGDKVSPASGTNVTPTTGDGNTARPTRVPTAEPTPTTIPAPLTRYDRELVVQPDNIELRLQRGNEYLQLKAYAAAQSDFEHVIALEKERAEAYAGLGQAMVAQGIWGEAEVVYNTAISFDDKIPAVHFNLGMLHYYRARYAEAAGEFDWAAELNPDFVEAECWLAIAAAQAGEKEEALGAAARALSLTQELPLAYIASSWARRVQDPPDLDGAQGDLLYAQSLEPYNFEVLNAMARFYTDYRPERIAEAEQAAQYAVNWAQSDFEKARGLHTLGRIYLAQGRKEEARSVLNQAASYAMADGRIAMPEIAADLEKTFAP